MTHLAVHSSGHEVRTAQLALNIYFFGRRVPPLAMDGIFGGLMKCAVEDFQRERHIANDPSGVIGDATWSALLNVRVLRMSMLPVSHNGSPGALALSIANPGRLVMPTPSGSASSAAAPAPLAPVPNVHLQPPVQTSAAPFWNLPNRLPIMFRHFQVQPTFNLNPLPTYSFANRTWSASPPWAVQGQPITINVVIAPRDPPNSDRIFRSEAHGEGFVGISNATAPSGENVSQLAIGGNVADLLIFSVFHFGFFHQATLSFSTMSNTLSFGTNGGISLAANFFDGAIQFGVQGGPGGSVDLHSGAISIQPFGINFFLTIQNSDKVVAHPEPRLRPDAMEIFRGWPVP